MKEGGGRREGEEGRRGGKEGRGRREGGKEGGKRIFRKHKRKFQPPYLAS